MVGILSGPWDTGRRNRPVQGLRYGWGAIDFIGPGFETGAVHFRSADYTAVGDLGDGIAFAVMVREGAPSRICETAGGIVVDGGPEPATGGLTRWPAVTSGIPVSPDLPTAEQGSERLRVPGLWHKRWTERRVADQTFRLRRSRAAPRPARAVPSSASDAGSGDGML